MGLNEVTLDLQDGSWTNLVGPSGSGKTTLLRAIAGLEPLTGGSIELANRLASGSKIILPPHERQISFVFQEPSLWPHLTAEANVALGIPGHGGLGRKLREARHYLERLGVAEFARKFPSEVSGGEAQRICIARAIAARPKILLLDEPTAHLDIHLREHLIQTLINLHEEEKLTTLCVMHQIEPPIKSEDRMVIIEQANIVFDGRLEALAGAPKTPFTEALLRTVRRWAEG